MKKYTALFLLILLPAFVSAQTGGGKNAKPKTLTQEQVRALINNKIQNIYRENQEDLEKSMGVQNIEKILDYVSKNLEAELAGTEAGERLLDFYETPVFRNSGQQKFKIYLQDAANKPKGALNWVYDLERIQVSLDYLEAWFRSNDITPAELLGDKEKSRRFVRCIAEPFVHESEHMRGFYVYKDKNLHMLYTTGEELLAYGWADVFLREKLERNAAYGEGCVFNYKRRTLADIERDVKKNYAALAAPFTIENAEYVIANINGRESRKMTLEDVLRFGTRMHFLKWIYLPLEELQKAVNGQSDIYNDFISIYEDRIEELKAAHD